MKAFSFLFFLNILFASKLFAQNKSAEPVYKIVYQDYVDLTHNNVKQLTPNFDDIVLRQGQNAVSWHTLAPNYVAVNNDSVKTIVPKGSRLSPVFKNYATSQVVFEYKSGYLKEKEYFFSDDLHPMEWVITNR